MRSFHAIEIIQGPKGVVMAKPINRQFFFDSVRASVFGGQLSQPQVDGLNFILDSWESDNAGKDDRWLAYALGTAHHETARKMQPIQEIGSDQYFFEMYDIEGRRPEVARRLGNTQAGDGVLFHGRGFVQITGRTNYQHMEKRYNIDLTSDAIAADFVLNPQLAANIMFYGMETGAFTGKRFADYFNDTDEDWVNARRIINGLDRAELVAGYAGAYYAAVASPAMV